MFKNGYILPKKAILPLRETLSIVIIIVKGVYIHDYFE